MAVERCFAPSEVDGITAQEASVFGAMAEELIYADFCTRYARVGTEVFQDANNPAAYLYFLAVNNPGFTQARQTDYFLRLRGESLMRVPDLLVHTAQEKAFYEIKPDSASGLTAGIEKVGILTAVYPFYGLPYRPGSLFVPRDHVLASAGTVLRVTMRIRRPAPGLLLYRVCLASDGAIELATLLILLRYVIREVNRQRGTGRFRPVDLEPAFRSNHQLADLARALGITLGAGAAAVAARRVPWRLFWRAVAARFAVRGTAAVALSAADGPLPVGELLSLGLAIWTVVDIIRLQDELWREAERLQRTPT